MRENEIKKVAEIQDLVGAALGHYHNDRGDRAENVVPRLEKAFQLCIEVLSKYPPQVLSGKSERGSDFNEEMACLEDVDGGSAK